VADLLRAEGVDCHRRGKDRGAREESGELSMKANMNPSSKGKSPSQEIDAIIKEPGDWRGKKLSQLRALIKKADPAVVEEVNVEKTLPTNGSPRLVS
jgi:hypothetical protein